MPLVIDFVKTIPEGVMDTYCWIHSTFTLPKHVKGDIGWEVAHPGVGPVPLIRYEEEVVEHRFYQWVCFTLFLQVKLIRVVEGEYHTYPTSFFSLTILKCGHKVFQSVFE